jgi:general secretion pathway protein B
MPAQSAEAVAAPAPVAKKPPPPPPASNGVVAKRPAEKTIPEDLRRDIEAFKDQVRQERSGTQPKPEARDKGQASQADVPPQQLRLPREVRRRLPAFLMTVHVYDKVPAKRFVLINALKMREGERTREGIQVDEILPDGAVLSYDGHRFYQER